MTSPRVHGIPNCDTVKRPTVIRRPVLECAGDVVVGFDPRDYAQRFG